MGPQMESLLSGRCAAKRPEQEIERPRGEDGALCRRCFCRKEGNARNPFVFLSNSGYVSCNVVEVVTPHPGRQCY